MNGPEVYGVIFTIGPSQAATSTSSGPAPTTASCTSRATAARRGRTSRRTDMPEFGRVSQIDASAFETATRVRLRASSAARRSRAVHLPHDGLRAHVDEDRQRHPPRCVRARRARGSRRRGLLYAATQHGVYVSYDDGDAGSRSRSTCPTCRWPTSSWRSNELVIATHGRGFWVLDNIAPLRQCDARRARAPTCTSSRRPRQCALVHRR